MDIETQKDERHKWLWDNCIKEDLEAVILKLAGEYQGARLIDLAGGWNYNRAIIVTELEFGTSIESIAENFLNELEHESDGDTLLFGSWYWMGDSVKNDYPF